MAKLHWAHKMLTKRINNMKYGSKIPRFLRLPSPVELGKSKINALPSSFFQNEGDNSYSWDDYYIEMKRDYPIKYFIYKTLTTCVKRKIIRPISDFKYYIISHTIRRYHMLDLRNKENGYTYGWNDADSQILFSLMAIMENFIIEQDTENRLVWLKEELAKDPDCKEFNWKDSIAFCDELLAMQTWWRIIRPMQVEKSFSGEGFRLECDEYLRKNDNDIMKKLIDMRHRMWT